MKSSSAMSGIVLLAWLALPAQLPAQDGSGFLKVIPESAVGFAVIQHLGETSAKIQMLGKLVNVPKSDDPLAMIKAQLGVDKGLDDKGSLVVVLLPGDGEPVVVVLVPVTDYKQFLTPLKPKDASGKITEIEGDFPSALLAAKKGNYAAFAEAKHRGALEKVLADGKDISAAMAPLQAWLRDTDMGAVLTPAGVKVVVGQVRQGVQQAKALMAIAPPEAKFMGDVLEGLDKLLKSAETEVTHLALGAQIDKANNVNVTLQALFAKGSEFAKTGASIMPLEGGNLGGLPAGPFFMTFGGIYPETTAQSIMNIAFQAMKNMVKDLPPEKAQKLEDAYSQMAKGFRGMTLVWSIGKDKEPLFASMAGTIKVDDAPGYLARYEKGIRAMNDLFKDAKLPNVPSYEVKKVEVGGSPGLEVVSDMSKAMAGGGAPNEKQLLELMFGEDGKMTVTLVAVDPKTILIQYTPADKVKGLLEAYKQKKAGLAADQDVAKTTAMLPAGSQWALYLSPHGMVNVVNRIIGVVGVGQEAPAFPKTPPVGFGVKISATGLETQIVVPAAVLQSIGNYSKKLGVGGT